MVLKVLGIIIKGSLREKAAILLQSSNDTRNKFNYGKMAKMSQRWLKCESWNDYGWQLIVMTTAIVISSCTRIDLLDTTTDNDAINLFTFINTFARIT